MFQNSGRERPNQFVEAAGAGVGVSNVGAGAGAGRGFGAGFLADATAGLCDGLGDGCAAAALAFAGCDAPCEVPVPGSGAMMLTGGVEAAEGKSALVGLPVGIEGGNPASALTAPVVGGALQLAA